jgi:thioredoxin-related protein
MRQIRVLFFILAATFGGLLQSAEQSDQIKWMDFNEGYALANAEGKIAVIDCYTDWCGWCKVMDKKTFGDSSIIEKMNEHFVAIKFNPEIKDKEYYIGGDTISGPQLLMALSNGDPKGYPTIFYYIPATKRMIAKPGYQKPEDFMKSLDDLLAYQDKIQKK